jgi:hypothetical protein
MDHRVKPGGDEWRELRAIGRSALPVTTLSLPGGDEKEARNALPRSVVHFPSIITLRGRNAVAQGDNTEKFRAVAAYTARLPSDFNQTLRTSMTKSLMQYYAPLEEISLEIRELLRRLDEQKL